MKNDKETYFEQPLGRLLSCLGRNFLSILNSKLSYLDIKRYYYSLILIEQGQGVITQQELADLLGTDKVSMVRMIDYLSKKGYVKRIQSKNDRRKYCLSLTGKALKEIPNIKKALKDTTAIALKGIRKNETDSFYKTLQRLKKNLNVYNL